MSDGALLIVLVQSLQIIVRHPVSVYFRVGGHKPPHKSGSTPEDFSEGLVCSENPWKSRIATAYSSRSPFSPPQLLLTHSFFERPFYDSHSVKSAGFLVDPAPRDSPTNRSSLECRQKTTCILSWPKGHHRK